jgi:hypothetical protein
MTFDSANKDQRPNTESSDANLPDAILAPLKESLPNMQVVVPKTSHLEQPKVN